MTTCIEGIFYFAKCQAGIFLAFLAFFGEKTIRRGKKNYMVLVPACTPFDCRTTYFFYFYIPYFSLKKEMI